MNKLQTIQKIVKQRRTLALCLFALGLISLLFIFDFASQALKPLTIVVSQPTNNGTSYIVKGDFLIVTFSKKLNSSERANISTSIFPETTYTQEWKYDTTLILTNRTNDSLLDLNKNYQITILNNNKLLSTLSFSTSSYYTLDPNQQFFLFKEGQSVMQDEAKRIVGKRPWITKLPISQTAYVVFWDDTAETVRVQLYIKAGGLSTQQKIQQAKSEISQKLTEIGVDINQEKITYQELKI